MKTIKNLENYPERTVEVRQNGKEYDILFRSKGVIAAAMTEEDILFLDELVEYWIEDGKVPSEAKDHPGSEWVEEEPEI